LGFDSLDLTFIYSLVYNEIIMEDIKTLLKEQEERIEERIKRHIDVLKEDFDSKVALIAEQYDSITQILDSHSKMIASIKEDIEIMKVDIAFIKNSLKKKVDVEEFEALERRVAILEAKSRKR
jgi:polyhydroxyalkanoate synthesis regulator phasin